MMLCLVSNYGMHDKCAFVSFRYEKQKATVFISDTTAVLLLICPTKIPLLRSMNIIWLSYETFDSSPINNKCGPHNESIIWSKRQV